MLALHDVALTQGERLLARSLCVALAPGQALMVQGANGSGKSTLLRTVCGLRPPARGWLEWRGQRLPKALQALQAEVAYLGHRDGLRDTLTPQENLHVLLALGGEQVPVPAQVRALADVGLGHAAGMPVRNLSQGQRRRAALARFLLTGRRLWVLDEPLAALDAQAREGFTQCVLAHLAAGGLAVITCHTESWPSHPSIQRLSLSGVPGLH